MRERFRRVGMLCVLSALALLSAGCIVVNVERRTSPCSGCAQCRQKCEQASAPKAVPGAPQDETAKPADVPEE